MAHFTFRCVNSKRKFKPCKMLFFCGKHHAKWHFFSSINDISCFASPILTSCTLSNRVWVGEWRCRVGSPKYRKDYQHRETTVLDPPPLQIKDRKMACFGFRRASMNFLFGGSGGGGGRGGGGKSGMGICCSMIFYLAEKAAAFLELGSRCCFIFPCFIGFCYEW